MAFMPFLQTVGSHQQSDPASSNPRKAIESRPAQGYDRN
jgi:hypothetical protein